MISIVGESFQTKRATAEPFLRGDRVDANAFLAALQKLAEKMGSTTNITKLPALTTRSNQRGAVETKQTMIEAEATVGPDGLTVDLNAALRIGDKRLTTTSSAKFGDAIFLGILDGANADSVQVVFFRILKQ